MKRLLTIAIILSACLAVGFRVIPNHTLRQLLQMPINEVWVDEGESIADAITSLPSGGSVYLRSGTHSDSLIDNDGKAIKLILEDGAVIQACDSIFTPSEDVAFEVYGGTVTQLDGTRKSLWTGDDISFYGTNINYYYINTDTSKGTDIEYWDECIFTRLAASGDDSMMVRRDIVMTDCQFYEAPIAFCSAWYDSCDVKIIDCYGENSAGACLHPSASYGQAIVTVTGSSFHRDITSLGYCVGMSDEVEFFAYNSTFTNKGGGAGTATIYAHGICKQDSTNTPNVQLYNCTTYNDSLNGSGYCLNLQTSDTIIVLGLTANEFVWFDSTEEALVGVGLGEPYIEYDGPPLNEIWVDEGMSIANAVTNCPAYGTVVLASGTYDLGTSPKIALDSPISFVGMGGSKYDVHITGTDSLFNFGSDSISFTNLKLSCTGAAQLWYAGNSTYTHHELNNCVVACSTIVFGPNSYWYVRDDCVFLAYKAPNGDFSAPEGWLFYGQGTNLDAKAGLRLNYPKGTSSAEIHGLWFAGGAKSTITWAEFKANDSPVIQADSSSQVAFIDGRILGDTTLVVLYDEAGFNAINTLVVTDGATEDNISLTDSSTANFDNCVLGGGAGSGVALHTQTEGAVRIENTQLDGDAIFDTTNNAGGAEGRIDIFGACSIQNGTFQDLTNSEASPEAGKTVYGMPFRHIMFGGGSFDGTSVADSILSKGISTTTSIQVTYTSSVSANDQGYIYEQGSGYCIWRRGADGTSGASYRWIAIEP